MNKLPIWVVPENFPMNYDIESSTSTEMVARLYGAMNTLFEDYNKFVATVNEIVNPLTSEANYKFEEFAVGLRQEFQDFIDIINLKVKSQDNIINNAIVYMKDNITESVYNIVEEMRNNGQLTDAILTAFDDVNISLAELTTALNEYIGTNDGNITTLLNIINKEITDRENAITNEANARNEAIANETNARNAIDLKVNMINGNEPKQIVIIGDSYGLQCAEWDSWQNIFEEISGYVCYKSAVGGSGFIGDETKSNFLMQLIGLKEEIEDVDKISDIVVLGGYNDASTNRTYENIYNSIKSFANYINENFPNAKTHIGFVGVDYRNTGMQHTLNIYNNYYRDACINNKVFFIENAQYILTSKAKIFFSDTNANSGFHPNTLGNSNLAYCLLMYLVNGSFNVIESEAFDYISIYKKNGDCIVFPNSEVFAGGLPIEAMTLPFNEWVIISDLSAKSNLLWGKYVANTSWHGSFPVIDHSGEFLGFISVRLHNKKLEANNLTKTNGFTINNGGYLCFNSLTIPFDSNY